MSSFLLHTKWEIVICNIICFLASLLFILITNFVTSMICALSFQFHASNNELFELGMQSCAKSCKDKKRVPSALKLGLIC